MTEGTGPLGSVGLIGFGYVGVVTPESELGEKVILSGVGHVEVRDTWHWAVFCQKTYGIAIRGVFY
jgi:hypothetical protein